MMESVSQERIKVVDISTVKLIHGNRKFNDIKKKDKKCPKCRQIKLLDRFSHNNKTVDKLCSWCKECVNSNHNNWYARKVGKNRNEIRKNSKNEFSGKIIDNQKFCGVCQQWKQIKCFNIDQNAVNKLQSRCRECHNLLFHLISRMQKMEFLIAYDGKCRCCGEMEIDLLTIEHIRNKGHELIYGYSTYTLMKKLKELNWPVGYEVLCFSCNQATKDNRPCVHTKEYRIYEEKLEAFIMNDQRLSKYNELVTKLNERRANG